MAEKITGRYAVIVNRAGENQTLKIDRVTPSGRIVCGKRVFGNWREGYHERGVRESYRRFKFHHTEP